MVSPLLFTEQEHERAMALLSEFNRQYLATLGKRPVLPDFGPATAARPEIATDATIGTTIGSVVRGTRTCDSAQLDPYSPSSFSAVRPAFSQRAGTLRRSHSQRPQPEL